MEEIKVEKIEEKYVLRGKNPQNEKELKVNLTVHFDTDQRTLSITGKNSRFQFEKSDPFLIEGMIELFQKAVEVGNNAQRVKLPKEEKS